eukprot:XP_019929051.1 PREDICTED: uncharacterized protein LOC105343599 [Crassostrea gigas]
MLSPRMHTNVHERRVSRKREKEKLRQRTVECKRRRHELKKLKSSHISTSEIKEGTTYESGVGMSCADDVIEEIPDCTPASKPVSVPTHTDSNLLYFDLETTGLDTSAEITQLARIFEEETFNRYVLPKSPISAKATAVTGLHVASGQLFYQQTKVNSVDIQTCLTEFNIWLNIFPNPILVCHNGKVFDSVILMRSVMQYPESGLKSTIAGFVDSLHVFREILPEQHSYKLQTLVQDTMGLAFNAHSALEDVKALQYLVIHHKVSYEIMLKHSFGVDFIISSIESKS